MESDWDVIAAFKTKRKAEEFVDKRNGGTCPSSTGDKSEVRKVALEED